MDGPRRRNTFSLGALALLIVGIAVGLAFSRISSHFRPRMAPNEAYAFDLPEYQIEPPDIVQVVALAPNGSSLIDGEFLVGPDGKVNVDGCGSVYVAGCSTSDAQDKIRELVVTSATVSVKVVAYNSKVYYLIHDANGADQVIRIPYTGSDNVLDALSRYREGDISKQNIWISRPTQPPWNAEIILIDVNAITANADPTQNYQLLPGDRLFVSSKAPPATTR